MLHCRTVSDSVGGEGVFPFLNVPASADVRVGAMKKIRFLASLVSLLLLSGCAVLKSTVKNAGNIEVVVSSDGKTIDVVNRTGRELTGVSFEVLVRQGFDWYRFPWVSFDKWEADSVHHCPTRFNYGADEVLVGGYSDQGKVKADWTDAISER